MTVDQLISDIIDEALSAVADYTVAMQSNIGAAVPDLDTPRVVLMDRLNEIKLRERAGRGDDVTLADPLEELARAAYRVSHLERDMTPPPWDFADQTVKDTWRSWAVDAAASL